MPSICLYNSLSNMCLYITKFFLFLCSTLSECWYPCVFYSYACDCSDTGYEGNHCEIDIPECLSDPCQHGGTCQEGVKEYTCLCWQGTDLQAPIQTFLSQTQEYKLWNLWCSRLSLITPPSVFVVVVVFVCFLTKPQWDTGIAYRRNQSCTSLNQSHVFFVCVCFLNIFSVWRTPFFLSRLWRTKLWSWYRWVCWSALCEQWGVFWTLWCISLGARLGAELCRCSWIYLPVSVGICRSIKVKESVSKELSIYLSR